MPTKTAFWIRITILIVSLMLSGANLAIGGVFLIFIRASKLDPSPTPFTILGAISASLFGVSILDLTITALFSFRRSKTFLPGAAALLLAVAEIALGTVAIVYVSKSSRATRGEIPFPYQLAHATSSLSIARAFFHFLSLAATLIVIGPLKLGDSYQPVVSKKRSQRREDPQYVDTTETNIGVLSALAKEHALRSQTHPQGSGHRVNAIPNTQQIPAAVNKALPPVEPRLNPTVSYWTDPTSRLLSFVRRRPVKVYLIIMLVFECIAFRGGQDLAQRGYTISSDPRVKTPQWGFYIQFISPAIHFLWAIMMASTIRSRTLPSRRIFNLEVSKLLSWITAGL
ncbi:hypothetical protein QBC38DRAFT_498859, partial [Podospora fimiseda]